MSTTPISQTSTFPSTSSAVSTTSTRPTSSTTITTLTTTTAPPVPSCDVVRVVVNAPNGLTDAYIRSQGLSVTIFSHDASVVGLTSRQTWKNMTRLQSYRPTLNTLLEDVSDFFLFEDVYIGTREPEGFWANFMDATASASAGGVSAAAKVTCIRGNATVITCSIPPTQGYRLSAAEGIRGSFAMALGQMLEPTCIPNILPSKYILNVYVEAEERDAFGAAVDAIGTVSNGVGALVGALIGASVMEIQFVSIQMQSLCMSELDRRSSKAMRYFISPFVDFNFAAVAFGNICIAMAAGLLQWGLSVLFMRRRGISAQDAWAAARFPSLAYGISQIFYMGVCYGAFKLLSDETDGLMVFGGAVAMFALGGYISILFYFIRLTLRAKFILYTQFLSRPPSTHWLYPIGFWDPDSLRLSFGHIINPFRDGCIRYNVQQFIVGFLVCLLCVLSNIDCFARFVLVALAFAASGCAYLYARPCRLPPVNFLCAVSQIVMAVWCILCAIAVKRPSKEVERAKLMLALCQVIVILVRVGYDFTITVLEESRWMHFRRPDLEGFRKDTSLQEEGKKKAYMEGIDMEDLLRMGTDIPEAKRKKARETRPESEQVEQPSTLSALHAETSADMQAPLLAEESLEMAEIRPPAMPKLSYEEGLMREGMAGMLDAFPLEVRNRHIELLSRLLDINVEGVEPANKEELVLGTIALRISDKKRLSADRDELDLLAVDENPHNQRSQTLEDDLSLVVDERGENTTNTDGNLETNAYYDEL